MLRTPGRRVVALFIANAVIVFGFGAMASSYVRRNGPDMLDLELSFMAGVFRQITTMWVEAGGPSAITRAVTSVLTLDLIFPIAYAALFSQFYVWLRVSAGQQPQRPLVRLPYVAAGFDYLENALLLWLLPHASTAGDTAVFVMSAAAVLKLSLLAVSLALSLAELFAGDRGRVIRTARYSIVSLVIGSMPVLALEQGRDLLVTLSSSPQWWYRVTFAVTLGIWAFSVWYGARLLLRAEGGAQPGELFRRWSTWLPRIAGMLTLVLPGLAFFLALPRTEEHKPDMMALGLACLVMAAMFIAFVIKRREWLDLNRKPQVASFDPHGIPAGTRRVLFISLAASVALFLYFVSDPLGAGYRLGAVSILTIAAANTVFFGSAIVFLTRRYRVPFEFIFFACAAVFSLWNDNHDVRLMAGTRIERTPLVDAFRSWYQPIAGNQSPRGVSGITPVFVVAAEGGGIRAAYWTASVLSALDRDHDTFARHLFAVSTVSGSSFGAAAYAGLQLDEPARARRLDKARSIFSGGFLAADVAALVTGDFAQWFVPFPIKGFDRSWAIERSFAAGYLRETNHPRMDEGFLALRSGEPARVPLLFFNGTSVDTGRRIVTSPVLWAPLDPTTSGIDLADLHRLLKADLTVATAAHNTARFPYVSPAGRIRDASGADHGHVVDGGYFENSGADTARDVIGVLRAAFPDPAIRFVVLVLRNTPDRERLPPENEAAWRGLQELGEVFAPLRAVLRTREARAEFALRRLGLAVGGENVIEFAVCPNDTPRADPPLGWELSLEMMRLLDAQLARCTADASVLVGQILRGER